MRAQSQNIADVVRKDAAVDPHLNVSYDCLLLRRLFVAILLTGADKTVNDVHVLGMDDQVVHRYEILHAFLPLAAVDALEQLLQELLLHRGILEVAR